MYFKKYLIVINEKKKDMIIDNKFVQVKKRSSEVTKFFIPKIETAPNIGIEIKKEIFPASTLLKFRNLAAVIATPDLLTPGIKDKI